MQKVSSKSFRLTSPKVEIIENDIQTVESEAFRFIDAGGFDFRTRPTFRFISNRASLLEPGSLDLHRRHLSGSAVLEDNRINCTCLNFNWFDSLSELSSPQRGAYFSFLHGNNFCFNGLKCRLSYVVRNFQKVCLNDLPGNNCFSEEDSDVVPNSIKSLLTQNIFYSQKMLETAQNILQIVRNVTKSLTHETILPEKTSILTDEDSDLNSDSIEVSVKNYLWPEWFMFVGLLSVITGLFYFLYSQLHSSRMESVEKLEKCAK